MLEAMLENGGVLKRVMDSIKDLVTDANFDCTSQGIALQAMDSSHVSLVALWLRSDGFAHYRCDRNSALGVNMASFAKILKCAANDDQITLRAEDEGDSIGLTFESKQQTRISQFSLKLIQIDAEHLGIPDTEYKTVIRMPSAEFQRICRELAVIGDTVSINATKQGVKFGVVGDLGNGDIVLKQTSGSTASSRSADEKDEKKAKGKKGKGAAAGDEADAVDIKLDEEVQLTFALRYLNSFAKATPLSPYVTLRMSPDVPLVVEYAVATADTADAKEMGHIRFYLAPKIEEDNGAAAADAEAEAAPAPAAAAAEAKADAKPKAKVKPQPADAEEDVAMGGVTDDGDGGNGAAKGKGKANGSGVKKVEAGAAEAPAAAAAAEAGDQTQEPNLPVSAPNPKVKPEPKASQE